MAALAAVLEAKLLEKKSQPPAFRFAADPAITVVQLELVLQTFLCFKKTSSLRSFWQIFIFDPHSVQDIMQSPFGFFRIKPYVKQIQGTFGGWCVLQAMRLAK